MSDCGHMFQGGDKCNAPRGGTVPEVVGFNFDQIASFTEDADGRITGITLNPGAVGYRFEGFRNDMKKNDEVVNPGVGENQFKHTVGIVIYQRTQLDKNNIEALCKGKSVWVTESNGKDDDAVEVHGIQCGLRIVPGVLRNAHENGGFFILNFATDVEVGDYEEKLPQSLGTDYADAKDILDALAPEESS